jgi:hypothetical protein
MARNGVRLTLVIKVNARRGVLRPLLGLIIKINCPSRGIRVCHSGTIVCQNRAFQG